MKKIIAAIALVAMVLCLCACGENNKEPRFIGTWEGKDGNGEAIKLVLAADGTATFENADGEFEFLWAPDSVYGVTLNWAGTPVEPAIEETETVEEKSDLEQAQDQVEAITETEEVAEDATEEIPEETTEAVPEETTAAAAEGETTGSTRKNDPKLVGYGALSVVAGEMILSFSEGSTTDILLFTYQLKKVA